MLDIPLALRIAARLPLASSPRTLAPRQVAFRSPNDSPLSLLADVRLVGVVVAPVCITLPLDQGAMAPQTLIQQLHRLHVIHEEIRARSRLRRRRRFALHL